MNPVDIAAIFDELEEDRLPLLFRLLPKELASETFVEMAPEAQELLIRGFSDSELKEVIDELYVDDAVDIVEEMPANVARRILRLATPETRAQINQYLKYPENSAGSIMTSEYVALRATMNVEQAFSYIRHHGVDKETIYTCYVVDNQRKLIGVITLKDLLLLRRTGKTFAKSLISTICWPCRWSTVKTVWWVLSRLTMPSTSWNRKPPKISRRWPLWPLRKNRT